MVKRLLLVSGLLSAMVIPTQAQTQKGNGILGGDIGIDARFSERLSGQTNELYKQTDVFVPLNIQYGYFVADNWLIGANVGATYHYCKSVYNSDPAATDHLIKLNNPLGVFIRHYWAMGPILLFGGAGVEGTFISNAVNLANGPATTFQTRHTRYEINLTAEVGATYFLSKRLALQGSIRGVGLPIPASNLGLGLVYWTGSTNTETANTETALSTTQQGNWVIEGGFAVDGASQPYADSTEIIDNKTSSLSTYVSIGRFIAPNTLFGVRIGFSTYTSPNLTTSSTYRTYSFSPYIQRYLTNRRLTPFLRGSLFYFTSRGTNSDKQSGQFGGSFGLGLAYLLTNRFLVETSLASASYEIANAEPVYRSNNFRLSAQLGSNLSLRYVINGRK